MLRRFNVANLRPFGCAKPTRLQEQAPAPLAAGLCIGLLLAVSVVSASAQNFPVEPRPQNQFTIVDAALDDADDTADEARDLARDMDGITCVDEVAFRRYTRLASQLAATIAITQGTLRKLATLANGIEDLQISGEIGELSEASAILITSLQGLKKCPPETIYRTTGPGGSTYTPGPSTPVPPPPPAPVVAKVCKECVKIADEIVSIDARIAQRERSQASLRKANTQDAGIQRAIREEDAAIADLKAQRATLEAKKAECERQCQPKQTGYFEGGHLGIELAKNSGVERKIERNAFNDAVTNDFRDSGDPVGIGIVAGYNFRPSNGNFVVGPFASFDYLRQTINHNFAGGQFLGSTTSWFGNVGVKAGIVTAPGLYLYGLAGAAFLNRDLNVNFATAARSNTTTTGFTAGLGAEYQPTAWRISGHPVSLFAQYQHTWWDNTDFNRPASSPAFNYAFQRQDDTFKLGVNFYFGAAPPAPPAYPVKAPVSK